MAVKASTQITISKVIDVYAIYRYYKLQSSTLTKPAKPTTYPPSGWSGTEPAYVSGSTNTLYFVDCNVYSDKSFSFSEVSKSSSYEAAKDAWNKANNAQNSIDNLEIGGRNLLLNSKFDNNYNGWILSNSGTTVPSFVTKYGRNCIHINLDKFEATKAVRQPVLGKLEPDTEYTVSGWVLTENIVKGTTNCRIMFYQDGYYDKDGVSTWFGYAELNFPINTGTGKWQYLKYTFTTDYKLNTATTYSMYVYTRDFTGDVYFCDLKLEKGNKATDWTPAPEDSIAKIDVEYYLSTSATSLDGGSWTTKAPTWVNGKYMWSRTVTVDGAGNKTYSPSQNGVCIAGAKGDKGKDAAVISSTEPSDKTYLWCDTSVSPPVLKQWNGEEWIVVNDNAEQITQIYKEITNSITQASENILMQVGEKTYSKEAVDRLLSDTNTSLEQTKESFNFEFNRFQTALDNLSNSSDAKFEDISKYIRFVNGEIHIGIVGNPIMLRQRNDRISFLENNVEVAYISNRTLYFTHAEVLKDLKIGRFSWVAMDSGYLALKLVE